MYLLVHCILYQSKLNKKSKLNSSVQPKDNSQNLGSCSQLDFWTGHSFYK